MIATRMYDASYARAACGAAHTVSGVCAVVVTHDRPMLLARCVDALRAQTISPDRIIVVDNASVVALPESITSCAKVLVLSLAENQGPAAGFAAGIQAALEEGASHVWLLDDDGVPEGSDCLAVLLATATQQKTALTCPLVRNIADRRRLAFPIRLRGHTHFVAAALEVERLIRGFAHLFNGALITADTFSSIGVPDARLFMRGDEVEFLLRARRAGLGVVTDTRVAFLHPACDAEVFPILRGWFYAMVPHDAPKRHCQFRNRGWIFAHYGMWGWLAADHVRYACHFLIGTRDVAGYAGWLRATWQGALGQLGRPSQRKEVACKARRPRLRHLL